MVGGTTKERLSDRERRDAANQRYRDNRLRDHAIAELRRREQLKQHKAHCEESFSFFVKTFWHVVEPTTKLIDGWPLQLISDILTSITDGHSARDIINVPPGFMKSYLLNVFWPAWEWGPQGMPGMRYLCASYAGALAERDNGGDIGRFSRLINSIEYRTLWGDRFRVVKDNAGLVENDKTGSKRVVTMSGGATTGFRGDRLLIDDANNPLDVESDTVRATTNTWLREVMPSRLNHPDLSAIICIQQRTHEEDATGILAKYFTGYRWTCYDAATEILTRQGWLRFADLPRDVAVFAVDPATLIGRWEVPQAYIKQEFHGDLILYNTTLTDLAVTPDHRMVFKDTNDWVRPSGARPFAGKRDDWRVRPAQSLPHAFYLPQAVWWEGYGGKVKFGGYEWAAEAFAEFMGWYLAEGCASGKACVVQIEQNRGEKADLLHATLEKCPFAHRMTRTSRKGRKSDQWRIQGKELATALEVLGDSHTKYAPQAILDLDAASLERFIRCYALGDGGKAGRNGTGIRISSRSKAMIDGLQECAAKAGMASSTSSFITPERIMPGGKTASPGIQWHIYIRYSKAADHDRKWYGVVRRQHISKKRYDGLVYCVTVPSGAVLVRRNGKVAVSGNCVPMHFDPMRMTDVVLTSHDDGRPCDVWRDPRGTDEEGDRLEGLFNDARGKLQLRPGSPMAKAEGALAWPERFSQDACDKLRSALGEYAYEGQYQQSPGVRGGGIIRRDWWRTWTGEYPELGTSIAILDTAVEEGEKNDWNAMITMGAFPGKEGEPQMIMTSAIKWRIQLAELVANVAQICAYRKVDYLLIERKTRGKDVHDEIVRLFANATWQTVLVEVFGTKTSRLKAISHLFSGDMRKDAISGIDVYSGGIMYAPDRDWADEVIDQVSAFPRSAHDDYVDCISMGLGWVRKNGVILRKVEWDEVEAENKVWKKAPGVPYAIRR